MDQDSETATSLPLIEDLVAHLQIATTAAATAAAHDTTFVRLDLATGLALITARATNLLPESHKLPEWEPNIPSGDQAPSATLAALHAAAVVLRDLHLSEFSVADLVVDIDTALREAASLAQA